MSRDFSQIIGAMLPRERRAVGIIALIAICRMFGLFALLPVLSIFAAGLDGATPALIGIAVGGYGLTQAALQIPFGALSDRIGRVPVILLGLLLFAGGSILAGLSDSINGVIAGRFLQGAGAISATLTALLADATREEVRTRSMAIFGIGIGSSFLLALIAGPVIAAATGVRSLFCAKRYRKAGAQAGATLERGISTGPDSSRPLYLCAARHHDSELRCAAVPAAKRTGHRAGQSLENLYWFLAGLASRHSATDPRRRAQG
jgi:hypothetical protein